MSDTLQLAGIERNIKIINDNLGVINGNLDKVHGAVGDLVDKHEDTRTRLDQFYDEFRRFVLDDAKQKERQFATTRIIEVRQELEKRFGHHGEVRRHATGVLQAADLAIVREDTMRTVTEELVLKAPGYWLAPALAALVNWLRDDRKLAEQALAEAIRRDECKTALFFALICRRARRGDACGRWLYRYFQMQNSAALDREVVVMLDAVVNGVFGGAAFEACSLIMEEWVDELEIRSGFLELQRERWAGALEVMTPVVPEQDYPTLRAYSPTWLDLETALAAARRSPLIHEMFERLFTSVIETHPQLEAAVDELLSSLVTNFDDEELPLRREELKLKLTVEEGGDLGEAARRYDVESTALGEKSDFAGLLTNAAMFPEQSNATAATQRFAVARSREWIASGFNDLVARERAKVPRDIAIKSGSFECETQDGSDESDIVQKQGEHYGARIAAAVDAVTIDAKTWMVSGGLALVSLFFLFGKGWFLGLLLLGAGGAYLAYRWNNLDNDRQKVRRNLEQERDESLRVVRAALAEVVDLRREISEHDRVAPKVIELLGLFDPAALVLSRPGEARTILARG